jgi:Fur family ferric uptake transcriptional regulator
MVNLDSDKLKDHGLKITLPRMNILKILEESPGAHFSAEDLYKKLLEDSSEIGLATVYRVLAQFEAAGIVNKHAFEGNLSVYELNHGGHHDHAVCIKCGRVEEFLDPVIEGRQLTIAKNMGFNLTDHSLYLYGVCKDCVR